MFSKSRRSASGSKPSSRSPLLEHRLRLRVFLSEYVAEKLVLRCLPLDRRFVEQIENAVQHDIPVALRFAAQFLVNGLHVVEQVRTGIEESGLVFDRHLVTQPQRPFDGHAGVAEIIIVEDLRGVGLDETAIKLHDIADLVGFTVVALADLPAFVAQAAAHGDIAFAGIEKLDLALATLFLAVGDDPDIGADAGVVEHLLRQGDDGLQPVVFDDPLADVALAGTGAAGEKGRAAEDDSQTRAVLELVRQHRLELADHVLEKKKRAVVDARQSGAKAPAITRFFHAPAGFPSAASSSPRQRADW